MSVKIRSNPNFDLRIGLGLALIAMFFAAKAALADPQGAKSAGETEIRAATSETRAVTPKPMKKWGYRSYVQEDGTTSHETVIVFGEDGDDFLGRYESDKKDRPLRRIHKGLITFGPTPKRKGQETVTHVWDSPDRRSSSDGGRRRGPRQQ